MIILEKPLELDLLLLAPFQIGNNVDFDFSEFFG
jgi:hypothetical protein